MRSWQPKMAYAAYRRVRWHKCFSRYLIVCCCDCCIVYLCDMERRIERYGVINGNVLTSLSLSLSLSVVFTFTKIFQYYLNTNTHAHASFMQWFFFCYDGRMSITGHFTEICVRTKWSFTWHKLCVVRLHFLLLSFLCGKTCLGKPVKCLKYVCVCWQGIWECRVYTAPKFIDVQYFASI